MVKAQFDVEFTRDGQAVDPAQAAALLDGLTDATSLLMLAHGWNNDAADARWLYDGIIESLSTLPAPPSDLATTVVMRIFWPSKKFSDADLIPGGGAASAIAESDEALVRAIGAFAHDPERLGGTGVDPVRAASVAQMLDSVPALEASPAARRDFVQAIRAILNPDHADDEDASREYFALDPEALFDRFAQPVPVEPPVSAVGGVASVEGGAASFFGDLVSGTTAAARRIANYGTYYQMKSRAGTVGVGGVAATLQRVRDRYPNMPIHLVGHSFGGRLVTAAAASMKAGGAPTTLTLLQAAFSHNGLASRFDGSKDGKFRSIVERALISGPIVITHTRNDSAVGVAYPLASRIAFDNAAALGDQNDPYGGMGRNGAQHTKEVSGDETELRPGAKGAYTFRRGSIYNLNADAVITGHSDVRSAAVANAIARVMDVRA